MLLKSRAVEFQKIIHKKINRNLYISMIYLVDIYQGDLMDYSYKGKPIMPTKAVLDELSNINLDLYEVQKILEKGFEIKKRKKNITEKAIRKGAKVVNVVVVDMGNFYKLIHVGEFTLTKKFRKLMEGKNGF